jgi:type III restriction enzyme
VKLQFDSNQDYQLHAIQSVVDLFEGQPLNKGEFEFSLAQTEGSLTFSEYGVGNKISLSEDAILENLKRVQERNGLTVSLKLDGMNFSVEMETGTGKTYVYLRTIYELNKKYGFKKFIIVVPSIAIREGVLKNLEITHEHFKMLYNKVPLSFFVYDSKNVSLLRGFATSNTIQVLVINIDSFAKDDNIINKYNDKLTGKRPIEFIQHTNPIVIVDEPQNMETPIRKKAIQSLNPCCTLRYSATHTELYNQVYRLGPVQAYDLGLVKQIEVDSVVTEQSYNQAFIKLESIKSLPTKVTAKVSLDCDSDEGVKRKAINVRVGDNLHELSNHREMYKDGYIVDEIDATEKTLSFTNGIKLVVGNVLGDFQDEIMKIQIRKTVEEHFKKELKLRMKGIKVLSLFFIDKVKKVHRGSEWVKMVYRISITYNEIRR